MARPTIGDNVASYRRTQMTQEQLAEASGISVETIRKLEQNERLDARMDTLRKLARALGVQTSALLAGSTAKSTAQRETENDNLALMELRKMLTPVPGTQLLAPDPSAPAPTTTSVRNSLNMIHRAYDNDEFAAVLDGLSPLLAASQALAGSAPTSDQQTANGLLAHAYRIAGRTLIQLRAHDLAYQALNTALDASTKSGNELRRAGVISSMCWLLMRQGRFAEAQQLALDCADSIEPRFSRAAPPQLVVWGWLMLRGAAAAARDARDDDANAMLDAAAAAAARLGDRNLDRNFDTAGLCVAKVQMQRVETAVVLGDPDRALALSATMPSTSQASPSCRWRHQLDVAWSHTQLGQYSKATDVLVGVRRHASVWLRQQTYAREIVETIAAGRRRAMSKQLAELANLVGVGL
ncbi:hypothetical protein GCM10027290_49700 [Micromonospora sonneratiae]|uniref:Helix-turn-helix domain-containing protein n=1 Tax=Micromonospora sonneratiae TaxID=1184706 RepID=A0ABW3YKZ3_9ACTN